MEQSDDMGYLPLPTSDQLRQIIANREFLKLFTYYECVRDPTALENLCASLDYDLSQQYSDFILELARAEEAVAPNLVDDRRDNTLTGLIREAKTRDKVAITDYDITGYAGSLVDDLPDIQPEWVRFQANCREAVDVPEEMVVDYFTSA